MRANDLLKNAIIESGLEQQQVAFLVKVTPGTLSKYVNGHLTIPNYTVGALADTLVGRTVSYKRLRNMVVRQMFADLKIQWPPRNSGGAAMCRRDKSSKDYTAKAA